MIRVEVAEGFSNKKLGLFRFRKSDLQETTQTNYENNTLAPTHATQKHGWKITMLELGTLALTRSYNEQVVTRL